MIDDYQIQGDKNTVLCLWEIIATKSPNYGPLQDKVDRAYYASKGCSGEFVKRQLKFVLSCVR
jgi:hypothetical protein